MHRETRSKGRANYRGLCKTSPSSLVMIKCSHRTSTSFLRHLLFRHPPELIKLPVSDPDECHDLWSIGYWWDKCTGSRKSPDSAPGLMTNQSIFPKSSVLHCMSSSVLFFPTDTDCNAHLLPFVFTELTWHLYDWQYPKGIRHCFCKQLNVSNTTDKHHTFVKANKDCKWD